MMRRTLAEAAIALFCAWHAFAVAVYAVPVVAPDSFSSWVHLAWLPAVTPYIYLTSQWQKWDLFSPDPPQEVIAYTVEIASGEAWRALEQIEPWHVPLGRRAAIIGLLEHMLESGEGDARNRFLELACRDHALPPGSEVRLLRRLAVLPAASFATSVLHTARCPLSS